MGYREFLFDSTFFSDESDHLEMMERIVRPLFQVLTVRGVELVNSVPPEVRGPGSSRRFQEPASADDLMLEIRRFAREVGVQREDLPADLISKFPSLLEDPWGAARVAVYLYADSSPVGRVRFDFSMNLYGMTVHASNLGPFFEMHKNWPENMQWLTRLASAMGGPGALDELISGRYVLFAGSPYNLYRPELFYRLLSKCSYRSRMRQQFRMLRKAVREHMSVEELVGFAGVDEQSLTVLSEDRVLIRLCSAYDTWTPGSDLRTVVSRVNAQVESALRARGVELPWLDVAERLAEEFRIHGLEP